MLNNLIQNKWYKFAKYLVSGILIMSAFLALVGSWYFGWSVPATDKAAGVVAVGPENGSTYNILCMVFGFSSLVLSVVLLSTKNNSILSVTAFALAVAMIVLLITFGSILMAGTTWVSVPMLPSTQP